MIVLLFGSFSFLNWIKSRYNYLGPGTPIIERIQRGDPPLNALDEEAMIHDIDYLNAKTLTDLRKADIEFINNVKKLDGAKMIKDLVIISIVTKMLAEDLGLLDKNYFSKINKTSIEDTT